MLETAVLRGLPDAVVVLHGDGRLRWANAAAERLFGVSTVTLVGTSALDFVHPDDHSLAALSLTSVQHKTVGTPLEVRVLAAEGWRLVEVVGANLLADPEVRGLVLSLRDLTDRRRWEVARRDDDRFRSLVQHAASILFLLDREGRVDSVSAAVTRLLGHDQEQVEGRPLAALVVERDRAEVEAALARALDGPNWKAATAVEVELSRGDDGPPVPFELSIVNMLEDPTVQGLVVSAHDITQLRATRAALEELAAHDPLTGLPNRTALLELLAARVGDERTAVIFLDLDGFKPINDAYGHTVGDEVLRQLAERLRASVRKGDVVARYGGDEFVVVAEVDDPSDVTYLTTRLVAGIERPFTLAGEIIELSASVGLAHPVPGDTPVSLLSRADAAMYLAKEGAQRRRLPVR
jgi:diguanylate cyclase (GGDEF)-like protein/PAS domain S-box-containing protein